ncbi:hypothetical protein RJE46_14230 [Cedecea neteri]|uniref:hypothetical protein n=1 Tax=Cedecea neteri TaxID=158822 RepID=UPI002892A9DD|nr:hypothetical protein [Cedecea neteri]WNJ77790.1 hypothetical protein RJE46_14230 [Cedecea neteri]
MGTRHLICVVKNGDYKVAQYGQWDGYPSGQGVEVLQFLKGMNREKFLHSLELTYQPTSDQIAEWWADVGHNIHKGNGLVNVEISQKYKKNHPSLHRDAGSDVLHIIHDSDKPVPLNLGLEFAADSLFCEWAYVIDFDKNTFETYEGFNTTPLAKSERFYGLRGDDASGYQPVRLKKAYRLDDLPSEDNFISDTNPPEDED